MGFLRAISGANRFDRALDRVEADACAQLDSGETEFAISVDAYYFGQRINLDQRLLTAVADRLHASLGPVVMGVDPVPDGHAAWLRVKAARSAATPISLTGNSTGMPNVVRQIVPPELATNLWWQQSQAVATDPEALLHPVGKGLYDTPEWAAHEGYSRGPFLW